MERAFCASITPPVSSPSHNVRIACLLRHHLRKRAGAPPSSSTPALRQMLCTTIFFDAYSAAPL
ncbi:hypothetical protein GOP47_0024419 [Adiantum capillus-veneris]|uniref:Uncharacterized protein n=1 Tax=Adiantum capillus-veneris TaxID=13818 RepID=A0A9D4U420_ADICA|nr:hypothetical protein GOP47_0024419 [Adiantum capillus-veneris]